VGHLGNTNSFELNLLPNEILALQQGTYGEVANQPYEVKKMVMQSILNRLRSGKTKEFGRTIPDILSKGYYAVKNKNVPYTEALSGKFNSPISQKAWKETQQVYDDIIKNKDFGNAMFYFTPEEVSTIQSSKHGKKVFNFNKVIPSGRIGNYETFTYPQKAHYKR